MRLSSKSKKKEFLTLIFDVSSSSVGGAVFCAQENGIPKIIYSIREPIPFEKEINFDNFLTLTLRSLEIVVGKICMARLGVPDKIYCTLLSPWYASETRVISFKKNVPFIFTTKFANSLIQKELRFFEEKYIKDTSNKKDIRPIELKNMKTMLNGYATSNPVDQKAKEVEITLFISMGSEQILKKIEEIISKHFHLKNMSFSSFAIASFSVVRDMFSHQDNFLLIDISAELTDISMIKKDILSETISFPFGYNYIVRGISSSLGCSLDEAKSYISLYKDKHMILSMGKKFEPVLDKLKKDWLKKFQESLFNLSKNISIPSTIFLTVDKNLADLFSEIIKNEEFNQYALTESKFKVIFLGTQTLHGLASFEENVVRDPLLTIESVYINRFLR